ncbi:histidine phosphatase superfamily [Lentinula raphanica]|uniref:Histidine phosphatase superfamily n=1 Tax=Lentinula raphanica TaxID=153919 RepID=A0AA38P4B1_9AGAR|nr:histidine phosphatase superfamily [Lentinula raphanica]KAJ3824965.1 histidine phosphatase superfamily [Lentinula raphanica]KAJ3836058.1 histidine phosphatase superfamily [Lentinula raphanica]
MIQTLYIARHGFRSSWATGNRADRNDSLSELGLTQAQDLATYLVSLAEDKRPTAIFSSPFKRCLQTSQPTSIALGVPIYVDHWISEWYSDLTASKGVKQPEPPSADILREDFPEVDANAWSSLWYPPSTGENVDQITDRMSRFLSRFIPEAETMLSPDKHQRILLVTHAAPVIALIRNLLRETESTIKPGCCSISEFRRDPDSELEWLPKRIGDCAHVSGEIREWGFEDYY